MSTPRLCMADNCENIATRQSIPHPWWFTCESHLSLCIIGGFAPFKPIEPEGVAAPLEPLNIETFKLNGATSREWAYLHRTRRDGTSGNLGKLLRDFAEAYAAAVSKNLTDKYAEMEAKWMRELLTVSNEIGEARAVSKNLQEERDEAISARKHTQDWYARHYGKLQDWARKQLPEPYVNDFFSCIANGTTLKPDGKYFEMPSAYSQLLADQTIRAETAEQKVAGLEKEIAALRETK